MFKELEETNILSRNMEDILKTEIKLLKITMQCEIKNTHWMALMAD